MTRSDSSKPENSTAAEALERHREIIGRTPVDHGYAYDIDGLLRDRLGFMAANCHRVLDVRRFA